MTLDVQTLFLVTIYVETVLGLLLLFVWAQNIAIGAVAWWGCAHLLRASSVALYGLYGEVPDFVSIDLANAVLLTTYALTWTGARVFDGRAPRPMGLLAGAIVWSLVSRMPGFADWLDGRILVISAIIATYTWLTAYEFWRGRGEPLVSRWPAVFLLFAHGALFLLRTPLMTILPWSPTNQLYGSVWLTVLSSEALMFTISIAFILLAMAKERAEHRHKTAALVDALTGIANRRAFLQEGTALAERQGGEHSSTAVLLIDLDHFKSVNDRFGHAIGDRVLQIFAENARASIGPTDLAARLGGEEFAILLRDADKARAVAIAETIRTAFAAATQDIEGRSVEATVSIGVVVEQNAPVELAALLAQADQALYCAKKHGRNRVEVASLELVLKELASPGDAPGVARSAA